MDNPNKPQLLEQYLRGELEGAALIYFEKQLLQDEALAKQFAELKELEQGVRYHKLGTLLEEMDEWEKDVKESEEISPIFESDVAQMIRLEKQRELLEEIEGFEESNSTLVAIKQLPKARYWWMAAAGIALLLSIGAGIFFSTTSSETQQLANEYFEPYPIIGNTRGGVGDEVRDRAFGNYLRGDFSSAVPDFEKLVDQGDSLALFYLGVALLGNGEAEAAILKLKEFSEKSNFLKDETQWYIGLSYLFLDDIASADHYLNKISSGDAKNKRNQLIKKLKN